MAVTVGVPQFPIDKLELALKNFEHPVDARLPERSQSPQERAADPHRFGSQR